jgi:hypothetical protein
MVHALLLLALAEVTPADAMRLAHKDCARVAEADRPYTRWLSLHNRDEKGQEEDRPVLNGHVNHLSRVAILTRAVKVGYLLRVDIRDYGWKAETWEKLPDPYFTVEVEKEWGYYEGPKWIKTKVVKRRALAPWLIEGEADKERVAELALWTQSSLPVTRADWFFNQTAAQKDRDGSGYYDLLQIKNEADVFKLIGFDLKTAVRLELLEATGDSGVTVSKIRAIERFDTLTGGLWRSIDFKVATLKKFGAAANPLITFGRDVKTHADGFEGFGVLPNGLFIMWGANSEFKLVDAVPGDIANRPLSKSSDTQIHPYISCLSCHTKGGLQDLDGWARNVLNPPINLKVYDHDKALELRQQYLRKLEPFLARDRAQYAEAVAECTGIKVDDYLKRLALYWERYEDARIDLAYAAHDVGVSADEFHARLLAAIKSGYPPVSLSLGALVHKDAKRRTIPIRVWEQTIPEAYAVIHATKGKEK